MATNDKQPLRASKAQNAPQVAEDPRAKSAQPTKAGLADIKAALAKVTDQQRHRSQQKTTHTTITSNEAASDARISEVEELKRQLEKARAKIERRNETIKSLEVKAGQGNGRVESSQLEEKLHDLIQRHQASKVKHQSQLATLQEVNAKLQTHLASHAKEFADLRRTHNLLETENTNLKRDIQSLRHSQTHSTAVAGTSRKEIKELEDERIKWKVERHRLEREVSRLEKEAEHAQRRDRMADRGDRSELERVEKEKSRLGERVKALEEDARQFSGQMERLEDENENLEELLEASAIAYRLLHKHSVPTHQHAKLQEQLSATRMDGAAWRARYERSQVDLAGERATLKGLGNCYDGLREERDLLAGIIDKVREENKALEADLKLLTTRSSPFEAVGDLEALEISTLVDLASSHSDLATAYLSRRLLELQEEYIAFSRDHTETTTALQSAESALSALQHSHTTLETRYSAIEQSHASCSTTLSAAHTESTGLRNEVEMLKNEIGTIRVQMRALEGRAKLDAEARRKAEEAVARSKMAEEALDEEVQYLREAYTNIAQYENLYLDLADQHALILARESAAIDEAEKLGLENAELVGHTNEGQKINYVEGVRREMVLVKQELATTRYLLNKAQDQIGILSREVEAYTTVQPSYSGVRAGASGSADALSGSRGGESTRIRVSRGHGVGGAGRQPVGGELVMSRTGKGGRSVSASGPIGGRG